MDNLTVAFDQFPEIKERVIEYIERKKAAQKLSEDAAKVLEDIDKGIEDLAQVIDGDFDLSIEDLEEILDEDIEWEIPDNAQEIDEEEVDYYNDLADQTISYLTSLYKDHDRKGFLISVFSWRLSQKELATILEPTIAVEPRDWEAFVQARLRVENFLKDYIDKNNWFLDSPVSKANRPILSEFEDTGGLSGKDLLLEIKAYRDLTPEQQAFVEGATLLSAMLSESLAQIGTSLGQFAARFQNSVNEAARLKELVLCRGASLAAGDFTDITEVALGIDICTRKPLSTAERAITAVGLFAGSGAFWRTLAKKLKPTKIDDALDFAGDITEYAANLIKHKFPPELYVFNKSARELLQGEDILMAAGDGLKSSFGSRFSDIVFGTKGDLNTKYLWTIDNKGVNVALEKTPWPTPRGNIVHTNLSSEASIGGEVWFKNERTVIVNAGSGRFGDGNTNVTSKTFDVSIEAWKKLGYDVEVIPFGQR